MSERETREKMLLKSQIARGNYEYAKKSMLLEVEYTRSWFKLEDIKEIMSEKEYQELLEEVETKARERAMRYRDRALEVSGEEMDAKELQEGVEELFQDNIEHTNFRIVKDDEGDYKIEECCMLDKEKGITRTINVQDVDVKRLAKTIVKVMQRHLDYGAFHPAWPFYDTGEDLKRGLEELIDRFSLEEGNRDGTELIKSAVEATIPITTITDIKGQEQGVGKDGNAGKDKKEETEQK